MFTINHICPTCFLNSFAFSLKMDKKTIKKFNTLLTNALKTWKADDLKYCMRMYVNDDEKSSDESPSNSGPKYEDNLALFSKTIIQRFNE